MRRSRSCPGARSSSTRSWPPAPAGLIVKPTRAVHRLGGGGASPRRGGRGSRVRRRAGQEAQAAPQGARLNSLPPRSRGVGSEVVPFAYDTPLARICCDGRDRRQRVRRLARRGRQGLGLCGQGVPGRFGGPLVRLRSATAERRSPTPRPPRLKKLAAHHCFFDHANEPAIELADRIVEMLLFSDGAVFFGSALAPRPSTPPASWPAATGARRARIRRRSSSRAQHAYHGMNAYGTSLGGIPANLEGYGVMIPETLRVSWTTPRTSRRCSTGTMAASRPTSASP